MPVYPSDRALAPTIDYLARLTARMDAAGWNPGDPAYSAAWRARDALHELTVRLHYQREGNLGVSKSPEPSPRPWEPGGSGRDGA